MYHAKHPYEQKILRKATTLEAEHCQYPDEIILGGRGRHLLRATAGAVDAVASVKLFIKCGRISRSIL